MKLRIVSLALRGRIGEFVDSDDLPAGLAAKYLKQGAAIELKAAKKKTTESKAKKKAETTAKD